MTPEEALKYAGDFHLPGGIILWRVFWPKASPWYISDDNHFYVWCSGRWREIGKLIENDSNGFKELKDALAEYEIARKAPIPRKVFK